MRRCKYQAPALLRLLELLPALLPGENNIPDGAATTQSLFSWAHRLSTTVRCSWFFAQLQGAEKRQRQPCSYTTIQRKSRSLVRQGPVPICLCNCPSSRVWTELWARPKEAHQRPSVKQSVSTTQLSSKDVSSAQRLPARKLWHMMVALSHSLFFFWGIIR